MTPTERKVLIQAVADGGSLTLDGVDRRPEVNGWWQKAAARLINTGFGSYAPDGLGWGFRINDAGRIMVKRFTEKP